MKPATLLAAIAALICGTASATVLTFYAGEGISYELDQNYGDNVTSTLMGIFEYEENGEGFTPNVTVDYLGVGGDGLNYWRDGFHGTTGVLNNEDDDEDFTTFKLVADDEHLVVLHSLLWSGYSSDSVPVDSITVTDENGTELYNSGAFDATGTNDTVTFGPITGKTLTVSANLTSAGDNNDSFGFDNVTLSQIWDPAVAGWIAPAENGRSIIHLQGSYPETVDEVRIMLNDSILYSSTNSLAFDFNQVLEPHDQLLVYGFTDTGAVLPADTLSFTLLEKNLALSTLDDFDGEYPSWVWEAVPGETWSGLKHAYESPTNYVMTGGDYRYYRKASYRNLPLTVTTNTHMSITYFSKLGPKVRSDSAGVSGIALSDHSYTNDGARFFEFRMGANASTSDDAYLLIYDGEGAPVSSTASPDINTWVEFRVDFDMSYIGTDGKYGLCSVLMKPEGATRWQAVSGLTQVEMKIGDPAAITKIGGIGHCSWSSYNGYYGFQPYLDDIRYCTGENYNLGAGTNLLFDAAFNEAKCPWRRDGQGRPSVPSMHTNNEPFHDGVYLHCKSSYTAEVYQVINLLNQGFAAEDIDSGMYNAAFGGWQFGSGGSSGQIQIEYLDINEQPISTNSLPVVTNTYPNWVENMATNPIPAQTRSIRYSAYLSNYARLDSAHLSVLGLPQEDKALTVSSIHGTPVPAIGTHSNSYGTVINCSVDHVNTGTTQYKCIGWTGTGSVPVSGTSNSVEITLTEDSSITWLWKTNYWLAASVSGNGSISVAAQPPWSAPDTVGAFEPAGGSIPLTATPDAGWLFMGWSGDVSGTNDAAVIMDEPKTVMATFSDDADGDGLLNSNEMSIGSDPWKSDTDGDGFSDKLEVDNGGSPIISDQWRINHIHENGGDFDLYPSNAVLNVAMGEMLMEVDGTVASLNLQLETSDDLTSWTNAGPAKVWTWTVDGEKKFFRVRSSK